MRNNFVAKHAQKSGSGFHEDTNKPENDESYITVRCITCGTYTDIDVDEYHCPECDSINIIEIGGLS